MKSPILNKFTSHLKNTIKGASQIAASKERDIIDPQDLLLGLALRRGSIGSEILVKSGFRPVKPADLDNKFLPGNENLKSSRPKFSPLAKRAFEKAGLISAKYKHKYIGTEHLLYGLIEIDDREIKEILAGQNINLSDLKQHLLIVLKSTSKFPDLTKVFEGDKTASLSEKTPLGSDLSRSKPADEKKEVSDQMKDLNAHAEGPDMREAGQVQALEFFCTDLTDQEMQVKIDPVIGRTKEIERLIHILSRRTKNNPILIGEPGTGKTAIVEGLAKKILEGQVPEVLTNKRILSLDLSLVVAGTIYRGEFESRIKQIIDEIKNDPDVFLFIDEVHTIIGAGSTSGSMDAANILKPSLAKGEIRCIGATTLDEFQKHIESDAALERRFQPILIEEPTHEETINVLRGIRENYEKFHRVAISDSALEAAVKLSVRYLQDKFLPDKAIDLVDEAASKIKIQKKQDGISQEIKKAEALIARVKKEKEQAVAKESFDRALSLKAQEKLYTRKLYELLDKRSKAMKKPLGGITEKDIAEVVSRITKIPLSEISTEEKGKLLNLEKKLSEHIIGQEEATKTLASLIRRSRAGLTSPKRPIGSFIFLGPTGVGKTEMARVLAKTLFDDENALIRIDMSEFSEGFQASKLIGAPAGYVGYRDGGKLTDQVKRRPHSVVLFDEIEKANPEIFNLLLQVLEDGQLTDATGRVINFKNTIIIMTSNIGLSQLNKEALGFESGNKASRESYQKIKDGVLKELGNQFRPEFLNRIDKIIVFKPLDLAAAKKIVELQVKELKERLMERGIRLELSPKAINHIAKKSFSPERGAREIRRVLQEEIENPVAERILKGTVQENKKITIDTKQKQLTLT